MISLETQRDNVLLKDNALYFFNSKGKQFWTYEDSDLLLRRSDNSSDKRSETLSKWQAMHLSEEFAKNPNRSQVAVFLDFTSSMMQLQKQLHIPYHEDRFLRDQLPTAGDIPGIHTSLRDRIPRISEQAVNRLANRLSEKRRMAGRNAFILETDTGLDDNEAQTQRK